MQHNKGNTNQSELSFLSQENEGAVLSQMIKHFKIRESFSGLNVFKRSGLAISAGLLVMLLLPFLGINSIYKMFRSDFANESELQSKKDSYYAIKNNYRISWRLLLLLIACRFLALTVKYELTKDGVKVFSVDDSTLGKSGKKIEGAGMVYDHVIHRMVLGFKILVLGYWDGGSFIPIDFSLHREKGKELLEASDKLKKADIKLSNKQQDISELQQKLKEKKTILKQLQKDYNDKGGKTRKNKLSAAQNAVSKANKRLHSCKAELSKLQKESQNALKEFKEISKKNVYFGLSKKAHKEQFSKSRTRNTNGYKRKKELDSSKIDNTIKMLKRAIKKGFKADYVLTDSWFFCKALLQCVVELGREIDMVSMAKIGNIKYHETMSGRSYYPSEYITKYARKAKYCRKLKIRYFKVAAIYDDVRVNLFFTQMGKNAKWRLLVTTDLSLKFTKLMEIYQIRWSIEIFFKDCKQYLGLGKCQSNDFDAQIADISLIFIRYMMLSFYKRIHYQHSIGGIFEEWSKSLIEATLVEKLWQILIDLLMEFAEIAGIDISTFFKEIIRKDNVMQKIRNIPNIFEKAQPA